MLNFLYNTEPGAEYVDEDKTGCRLNYHNQESNLTKYYSQSGCTFECELRKATQFCGCVPWDYPHLIQETFHKVCDFLGKLCFENKMKMTYKECRENCPLECYSHRSDMICVSECLLKITNILKNYLHIRYAYTMDTNPIDARAICSKEKQNFRGLEMNKPDVWMNQLSGEFGLPMTFIRKFQNLTGDTDETEEKVCERYINPGMAILNFRLADSTPIS